MPQKLPRTERVFGPYRHYNRWRILFSNAEGGRAFRDFETEDEAQKAILALKRAMAREKSETVQQSLEKYGVYLREEQRNKPRTLETTMARLSDFFKPVEAERFHDLNQRNGNALYVKYQEGRAVDTHRNTLSEAKTFLKWCVSRSLLRDNWLADVEGVGKRRKGKAQLRINEARRWVETALAEARDGSVSAAAALCALFMGLRASEIALRVVRDLDDGGTVLWIEDAKTPSGNRHLAVPELLQPLLLQMAKGKAATARLFGEKCDRHAIRRAVRRFCRQAGVMRVGPHAMRGLHATLAVESGATTHAVAQALGHSSFRVTAAHYAKPDAIQNASAKRVEAALQTSLPKAEIAVTEHEPAVTGTA